MIKTIKAMNVRDFLITGEYDQDDWAIEKREVITPEEAHLIGKFNEGISNTFFHLYKSSFGLIPRFIQYNTKKDYNAGEISTESL